MIGGIGLKMRSDWLQAQCVCFSPPIALEAFSYPPLLPLPSEKAVAYLRARERSFELVVPVRDDCGFSEHPRGRGAWEQIVAMWDLVPTLKLGVRSGYQAKKS